MLANWVCFVTGNAGVMARNVFRFCTALRGLWFVMVLLVLGVVGVSYYAVVLTNCGPELVHNGVGLTDVFVALALGILVLFHALGSVKS